MHHHIQEEFILENISTHILFLILFLLIGVSAFFSASEIGMMSLNRYRLRHLVRKQQRSAMLVNRLLQRPDRLLGVILIGNTFANILASSVATMMAARYFGDLGILLSTVALTLAVLIFGEIAPKTLAANSPMSVALRLSYPLWLLKKLLSPFIWFANSISNLFLRLLGINVKGRQNETLSREELRTIVHEAESLMPSEHQQMLLRILDFEKVTVDDVMIPRNEVLGIDLNKPWEEVLEQLETSQHTRLPIYENTIDHIKGIIHLRTIAHLMISGELTKEQLLATAEKCYFVPENTSLHTQLINFKKEKQRTCLVVDEYGDIIGLVTLQDILEEIVGEFTTDIGTSNKMLYPQEDGSVLVDAGIPIRELNRLLQVDFSTEGPKTLSGLIIERLEFIPPSGTCVCIMDYPIEVVQVKDNMIKTAKVFPKRGS